MTWTKLDDTLHSHPKVLAAWDRSRASLGLHLLALSYAGCYLTDGHVPERLCERHLPRRRERERAVEALVDAGLWEPTDGGWQIHDYLDFNRSRAQVEARRQARSDAGRAAAATRWSQP